MMTMLSMETMMGATATNDAAAAALRRAVGFAALFGLAGMTSLACTMRTPEPVSIAATDRLLAEEARLTAQLRGAEAIVFPTPLLARRHDPIVASALGTAQQRFVADRAAMETRRDRLAAQIGEARAERDLYESRRNVLLLKLEIAQDQRAAAQQRRDAPGVAALSPQIAAWRIEAAGIANGAARAAKRVNALEVQMATLARTTHAMTAQQLTQVQAQLRGATAG